MIREIAKWYANLGKGQILLSVSGVSAGSVFYVNVVYPPREETAMNKLNFRLP